MKNRFIYVVMLFMLLFGINSINAQTIVPYNASSVSFNSTNPFSTVTLTGNISTFTITAGTTANQQIELQFCQDAAGSHSVTSGPANFSGDINLYQPALGCTQLYLVWQNPIWVERQKSYIVGSTSPGNTPVVISPTASLLPNPLARYDFLPANVTSTTVTDLSTNSNNATFATSAPTGVPAGLSFVPANGLSLPTALTAAKTFGFVAYINPATAAGMPDGTQYKSFLTNTVGYSGIEVGYDIGGHVGLIATASPNESSSGQFGTTCNTTAVGYVNIFVTLGTSSGDLDHIYLNGSECGSYLFQTYSAGLQTSGNYYIGASPSGNYASMGMTGTMYYFEAFAAEQTASAIQTEAAALNYQMLQRNVAMKPTPLNLGGPQLIAGIDSITAGYPLTQSNSWLAKLSLSTNQPAYHIVNLGVPGFQETEAARNAEYRDALYCKSSGGPSVYINLGGVNDLSGNIPYATVVSNMASLVRTMKAAGCRVYVATILDSNGNNVTDATKDTYDNAILQNWKSMGADGLIDFAAIPCLGADGAAANTTPNVTAGCFSSYPGLHPSTAGYQLMANAASNKLNYDAGYSDANPNQIAGTGAYTMQAGDGSIDITSATSAATAITLPSCLGQTGALYTINNLQSLYTISVLSSDATQPISGLTSSVIVPPNGTLSLRDVANPKTVAGCHWEPTSALNAATGTHIVLKRVAVCNAGVAIAQDFSVYDNNAPALGCVNSANSSLAYASFVAAPSASQYVAQTINTPQYWTGTDIQLVWQATPVTGNVSWVVKASCINPDSVLTSLSSAPGVTISSPASTTSNGVVVTPVSSNIFAPGANSCTGGSLITYRITRSASDTLAGPANLLGVIVSTRRSQ